MIDRNSTNGGDTMKNNDSTKAYQEIEKIQYSKPVVEKIELVADETLSLGCWQSAPSSC